MPHYSGLHRLRRFAVGLVAAMLAGPALADPAAQAAAPPAPESAVNSLEEAGLPLDDTELRLAARLVAQTRHEPGAALPGLHVNWAEQHELNALDRGALGGSPNRPAAWKPSSGLGMDLDAERAELMFRWRVGF